MTEQRKPRQPPERQGDSKEIDRLRAEETERRLGRAVALGLPVIGLLCAIGVGVMASVGSALLVAAASALLGTITLLWASLRTLSGDAPLPEGLEDAAPRDGVDALAEQKLRALLALKDLENEHALGRIDDADYEAFQQRYREDAKDVMRQMDARTAPARADAERIAREYVARHAPGSGGEKEPPSGEKEPAANRAKSASRAGAGAEPEATPADRISCRACGGSNEADATFCKHCGAAVERATDYSDARA
jgi:hypothetical protein